MEENKGRVDYTKLEAYITKASEEAARMREEHDKALAYEMHEKTTPPPKTAGDELLEKIDAAVAGLPKEAQEVIWTLVTGMSLSAMMPAGHVRQELVIVSIEVAAAQMKPLLK